MQLNKILIILALFSLSQAVKGVDNPELLKATSYGDSAKTEKLLNEKANPNIQDAKGFTPLIHAAINGDANSIQILLAHGANPNIQTKAGYTPLMLAIEHHKPAAINLLVNDKNIDLDLQDSNGYTALMHAIADGQKDTVATLLQNGADKNLVNNRNETALNIARRLGNKAIEELLAKDYPSRKRKIV